MRFLFIDFAKDGDYDHEFMLWCAIASTYVEYTNDRKIDISNLELKKSIFSFLLGITTGEVRNVEEYYKKHKGLALDEYNQLLAAFAVHHNSLFEFLDESMKERYKRMLKPREIESEDDLE